MQFSLITETQQNWATKIGTQTFPRPVKTEASDDYVAGAGRAAARCPTSGDETARYGAPECLGLVRCGATRPRLDFAHCGVGCRGQIAQEREERIRLATEESHRSQKLDRSRGCPRCLGRTDYRTCRQVGVDERARFRHDQVGLEHLPDCIAL